MTTRTARLTPLFLAAAIAAACGEASMTAPDLARPQVVEPFMAVVVDTLDPNTQTHTFDDLPLNCDFDVSLPNPYEGLIFASTPWFAVCVTPNGTQGLIPADQPNFGVITELLVDLPAPATSVSLDVYDFFTDRDLTLNAYDSAGTLVDSASDPTNDAWITLSVSGDIHHLGIATDQGNTYLDNLTITYAGSTDGGGGDDGGDDGSGDGDSGDEITKDACMNQGWTELGFRNQGQCVRFAETGKDSR